MARYGLVLSLLPVFVLVPPAARSADPPALRWRTDYAEARREAEARGVPLFLKIGSEACVHCKRMDAAAFVDPTVRATLNDKFVPLVIDGHVEQGLVRALGITLFPTCVLAGADGKIHQTLMGYQTADQVQAALQMSITTAKAEAVVKAATGGAKKVPERGREVLALAKEAYRTEQFAACLEHCEFVVASYAESPEAKEATAILVGLKADATRLALVAEQLGERAAATHAAVGEAYLKTGDRSRAAEHFEKAVRTNPDGKAALVARVELAKLTAVPASRQK